MNLFKGTIESRVLGKLKARIAREEREYEVECKEIDKTAELAKVHAADKRVDAILGKFA